MKSSVLDCLIEILLLAYLLAYVTAETPSNYFELLRNRQPSSSSDSPVLDSRSLNVKLPYPFNYTKVPENSEELNNDANVKRLRSRLTKLRLSGTFQLSLLRLNRIGIAAAIDEIRTLKSQSETLLKEVTDVGKEESRVVEKLDEVNITLSECMNNAESTKHKLLELLNKQLHNPNDRYLSLLDEIREQIEKELSLARSDFIAAKEHDKYLSDQ